MRVTHFEYRIWAACGAWPGTEFGRFEGLEFEHSGCRKWCGIGRFWGWFKGFGAARWTRPVAAQWVVVCYGCAPSRVFNPSLVFI